MRRLHGFGQTHTAKVTRELWRDLYEPGLYQDLWFRWDGKPLILADPALVVGSQEQAQHNTPAELRPGHTLGQSFTTKEPMLAVSGSFPTWRETASSVTLTLRRGGPTGEIVLSKRFANFGDNASLRLELEKPAEPGAYYLEASDPKGRVGWWSHTAEQLTGGEAFADGAAVAGDRTLRIVLADDETKPLRNFFTFRKPQPDYFQGPTQPNMWSWLEVYPQHRFTNSAGVNEQMSVGVGQNAVDGRLGSMSEPGARGRSFHSGKTDGRLDAVRHGFNVAEQWEHALREDPRFNFVTGWNEWIAGRFAEFNGVKLPVMFVDQFDQEHSRDIEPMRGGHGDDYYCQLVSYIRRYKGAREQPSVVPQAIQIDGKFEDWGKVQPEFRDTIGDPVQREHRGWDPKVTYQNQTGRNDFVVAKMSWDQERAYFYIRTAEPITEAAGTNWMNLLIDIDMNTATGWLGYDFIVNFPERGLLARHTGEFRWKEVGYSAVQLKFRGKELELSIPWRTLGGVRPARLDFKWTDNCFQSGDWTDLTLNGDAAPNDRFNYRAILPK